MVDINYLSESNTEELKTLIQNHYKFTSSQKSKVILDNWEHEKYKFKQVVSPEYKAIIESNDVESLVG
jgi:glutamate synthase domain-containing protein 3